MSLRKSFSNNKTSQIVHILQHLFLNLKEKRYKKKSHRFITAIEEGDHDTVEKLLQKKLPIDIRIGPYQKTALLLAAGKGYTPIVQLLVQHGADINAKDNYGKTALIIALHAQHTEIARYLLAHDANSHAKDILNNTALMHAAYRGYTHIVQRLIAKGQDINAQNILNDTALMQAARGGHQAVIECLFDNGIKNIDAINIYNVTALMCAVGNRHIEVTQYLINQGADINLQNEHGEAALFWAVYNTDIPLMKLLLANKANIHAQTESEMTLLHTLAYRIYCEGMNNNIISCVKLLLLCGSDRALENHKGQTAEDIAPQIRSLAAQVGRYRQTLAKEYRFFKSNRLDYQAILDWTLLTPREKALNKFLSDRNVYADLTLKTTDSACTINTPAKTQTTDTSCNHFAKLPQEIIDRIRFFLFPPSVSQHAFAGKVLYKQPLTMTTKPDIP